MENNNLSKFFTQLGIVLGSFFCLWMLISQITFTEVFKINEKHASLERKLGDFYSDAIDKTYHVIKNDSINIPIKNIIGRICEANDMDPSDIKLRIVKEKEINAFAYPDNNLVIFSGLINDAKTPEELTGVIAHELAHMKHKHVMKTLASEIGAAALATLAYGGGRTTVEAIRLLSSSAYSRDFEREADKSAIIFMINAEINPMGFVDFMYRLASGENKTSEALKWISTHPDSEQRSMDAIEQIGNVDDIETYEIMTKEEWEKIKNILSDE